MSELETLALHEEHALDLVRERVEGADVGPMRTTFVTELQTACGISAREAGALIDQLLRAGRLHLHTDLDGRQRLALLPGAVPVARRLEN